jgi:hypothetical protein
MGPRPSSEHSIERINNDGDYSPTNCRWATPPEQGRNKISNRLITHAGRTMTMIEWAEELCMRPTTLSARVNAYGWSDERALTTPVGKYVKAQ